ncbi:glycosyltransferase [Agriterribacter sp.]|uniref:glycosyltransferase n=1 Tax=Agriterribacter sp. TaxID=2821509 RepID=UPI002BA7B661|nr:glycosyltransferase [Agriterribacter sp.]HRO45842.1 glycosyltransferase [Agriterribacter sp.]HRQ16216.1 glycosyltransferase [Agriterribacter sp.]
MKRKIVIIGPAHPLRGGLASYDERLAKEFQQQGWDTHIYTFSLQYPGFLFPGTTQYSSEPPPAGLDIHVRINSVNPFNWYSVGRELQKLSPDIIVVRYWLPFMGPCLGTILRVAKKNKRSKIVCIADNIIPHEKRPGDTAFTRYFLKAVDAFITMSEKVLADLRMIEFKKTARFVPHPLYDNFGEKISKEAARHKLGLNKNDRIVLFFGFIRKYKGFDILLDAMKIVKEKVSVQIAPPVKLLVAGEFYEDSKPYLRQIKDNDIEDVLILKTDFVPDSEVKYYLCAADVVIQPYRNATQSGVTPLAYHFETPMIITNVGGLTAMVPDGKAGLVAEPDAGSIAVKIFRFYEMGEDHFIPGLIEEKKKYTWDNMVKAIEEVSG